MTKKKKMRKRISLISAVALDFEKKVQKLKTLLDAFYDVSFPDIFEIK